MLTREQVMLQYIFLSYVFFCYIKEVVMRIIRNENHSKKNMSVFGKCFCLAWLLSKAVGSAAFCPLCFLPNFAT